MGKKKDRQETKKSTTWNYPLFSFENYYVNDNWEVIKDEVWNTTEDWYALSKEYTWFYNSSYSSWTWDADYKRFWRVEFIWDIIWDWWTKEFEVQVLVDGELLEIWESDDPYKRKESAEDWVTNRFRILIDLYDDGRAFQFRLIHSWSWKVTLSDVNISYKKIKNQEYYY